MKSFCRPVVAMSILSACAGGSLTLRFPASRAKAVPSGAAPASAASAAPAPAAPPAAPAANANEAPRSDFLALCQMMSTGNARQVHPVCTSLQAQFFTRNRKRNLTPFAPSQLGLSPRARDKKTQFIVFNDPNLVPAVAYCYFVFRGWLNAAQITTADLGLAATSFSIVRSELGDYASWLAQNPAGKSCAAKLQSELALPAFDLVGSLGESDALIGLNPIAAVKLHGGNREAIDRELRASVSHERILVELAICARADTWAHQRWRALPLASKSALRVKYPAYNWNDERVARRESLAMEFEARPNDFAGELRKQGAGCN